MASLTATPVGTRARGGQLVRGGLAVLGAIAVVLAVRVALVVVTDPEGPLRVVAGFFDLVGADSQAAALRSYGLTTISRRAVIVVVALTVGTAGAWALYRAAITMVEQLSLRWQERLLPWVFVGPALALLGFFLVYPIVGTVVTSLTEDAGIGNYAFALTDPDMLTAFRNNALWLVLGTGGSVVIGLAFAGLVDRIKREALAKTIIFLPMAISMVGASVIWRFVYAWRPESQGQIGIVNAVLDWLGFAPVPWMQTSPWNTLALIVIMVWLLTGFAMVVLSAAIKGVDNDLLEAGRIDGASELRVFWHIVLPSIRGAMITVGTTILVMILKVFDIVFVMTGGKYGTDVVANRMFSEMFKFNNFGRASALAVLLLVAVVPIMVINVRNLRHQGIEADQ